MPPGRFGAGPPGTRAAGQPLELPDAPLVTDVREAVAGHEFASGIYAC
ncbi:hypothetical protein ACFQZ8_28510 [Micromonospora azadirachtae]|uniref:Uncharacterized protein n=1 Tax=Micromonospora azadirachtae TaxID=1970735 RepID=A0ABW3AA88_9ACTN